VHKASVKGLILFEHFISLYEQIQTYELSWLLVKVSSSCGEWKLL